VRIALLADSHGFVPALEAALASCRAAAPDLVVILGDVLTCPYSPDPAGESIALARNAGVPVLLGNHELLLRSHGTPEWEKAMAMRAVRATQPAGRWTEHMAVGKSRIAPADLAWLHTLPAELAFEGGAVFASHGLPGNPFLSVDGIDPRETNLAEVRAAAFARPEVAAAELVVCAHNHVPLVTVRALRMVVRVAAACGWGDQGGRDERFGGYAVLTRRGTTWEVEHRVFPWRPRDPTWTWAASVAADP
jgi:diadenosine tetraphosphatase ApaH/serine/threonine PP2A family protein phosphatase